MKRKLTGESVREWLSSDEFATKNQKPMKEDRVLKQMVEAAGADTHAILRFLGASLSRWQRDKVAFPKAYQLSWFEKFPHRAKWLEKHGYSPDDAIQADSDWDAEQLDVLDESPFLEGCSLPRAGVARLNVSGPTVLEIASKIDVLEAADYPSWTPVECRTLLILDELRHANEEIVEWASVSAVLNAEYDKPAEIARACRSLTETGFLVETGKSHKSGARRLWFKITPCVAVEADKIWKLLNCHSKGSERKRPRRKPGNNGLSVDQEAQFYKIARREGLKEATAAYPRLKDDEARKLLGKLKKQAAAGHIKQVEPRTGKAKGRRKKSTKRPGGK